jgi:hypothetical protein
MFCASSLAVRIMKPSCPANRREDAKYPLFRTNDEAGK